MRSSATLVILASGVLTALAATASATGTELYAVEPGVKPSCPESPCLPVSRTTAFQVSDGPSPAPTTVTSNGRITAWQITLASVSRAQEKYFDGNDGGASEAALAVIEPQSSSPLGYKLVALAPLENLEPYFGMTARFSLSTPITVHAGDVIAITVPTWAPALALGLSGEFTWRASRSMNQCASTSTQTSQVVLESSAQYECLYETSALTYGATLEVKEEAAKKPPEEEATKKKAEEEKHAEEAITVTLTSALAKAIIPSGKAAKLGALLKHGGLTLSFNAPTAGRLVISWYSIPKGGCPCSRLFEAAHLSKKAQPALVASGKATFAASGIEKVFIKLTNKGRQLLKHAKKVKLTAKGSFTQSGKAPVVVLRAFALKR